jgi:hypothetical protein
MALDLGVARQGSHRDAAQRLLTDASWVAARVGVWRPGGYGEVVATDDLSGLAHTARLDVLFTGYAADRVAAQ